MTAAKPALPLASSAPPAAGACRDLLVALLTLPALGLLEPPVAAADVATREEIGRAHV